MKIEQLKNKILCGDSLKVLKTFPDECIDCIVTSPPYWGLRDYGVEGQLGLESTFQEYINKLCDIFDESKKVLKKTGTCWVVIGDCYAGAMGKKSGWTDNKLGFGKEEAIEKGVCLTNKTKIIHQLPQKCLVQIPHRFAIEMCNRGWILRNTIIWHKNNCMPSSASDRFTIDFEYVFFFVKNKKYFFNQQFEKSIDKESYSGRRPRNAGKMFGIDPKNYQMAGNVGVDGKLKNEGKTYPERNKRCVWNINTKGFKEAHFAVFPEKLIEPMIDTGCPKNGIILDTFMGACTSAVVAKKLGMNFVGIELNPDYIKIGKKRLNNTEKPLI